jgi:hypothetical protein
LPAFERRRLRFGVRRREFAPFELLTSEYRPDPGDQQALGERFRDIVVGAHREAQRLIELIVLRRQEDYRHRARFAHPPQQLHAVHLRHLDVEHGKIGGVVGHRLQGDRRVRVDARHESFGLEADRDRRKDVAVVIDQRDYLAHPPLVTAPAARFGLSQRPCMRQAPAM